MGNKEFDSKIRDLMEGYHELPGEGAWEAIESSLDSRRRARVVYFRRAVVASAAVAASVVLFLVLNRVDIPVADTPAGNLVSVVESPGVQAGQHNQPAIKETPEFLLQLAGAMCWLIIKMLKLNNLWAKAQWFHNLPKKRLLHMNRQLRRQRLRLPGKF